jgi:predicted phage tail protein
MQHSIYLQGELGERFGHKFSVHTDSCPDIFKCINANRPEFKNYVMECAQKGIAFNIKHQEMDLLEDDLLRPLKKGDITISIIPVGSKKGWQKILAAVVLFWVGGWAAGLKEGASFMGASAGAWSTAAYGLATNLALAGIAQIMAQDPSTEVGADTDSTNYLFNGSAQNIKKGDPVPVLYGELRVPGRPISTDIISGIHNNPMSLLEADNSLSVGEPDSKEPAAQ